MKTVLRGLVVFVLLLYGTIVSAQVVKDENLMIDIPDSKNYYFAWQDEDPKARVMLIEYIPEGQTLQNWREMVTLIVNSGNKRIAPDVFARKLMAYSQEECGGPLGTILKAGGINGYPFALFFYGCAKSPLTGKPEWNLTIALKGQDSFYTVSKAWIDEPDPDAVAEWRGILEQAYICDTRRPQNPCHGTPDAYFNSTN